MVSYTDPVHSFIISYRAVEPTGSSLQLLLGIVIGNYHLHFAIALTNKTILITGWNWSCLETFLLFTTMATAGNWLFKLFIESQIWSDVAIWHSIEFHIKLDQILFFSWPKSKPDQIRRDGIPCHLWGCCQPCQQLVQSLKRAPLE